MISNEHRIVNAARLKHSGTVKPLDVILETKMPDSTDPSTSTEVLSESMTLSICRLALVIQSQD